MSTDTERASMLVEMNKFTGLSFSPNVLTLGRGTPYWDALEAAWPYWQAGCRPTKTTNTAHNAAATLKAIEEMNAAGGHSAYEMRTMATHPATRFLAALLLDQKADSVEFPWDVEGGAAAPSANAIADAERRGYQRAIADVLAKVGGMK